MRELARLHGAAVVWAWALVWLASGCGFWSLEGGAASAFDGPKGRLGGVLHAQTGIGSTCGGVLGGRLKISEGIQQVAMPLGAYCQVREKRFGMQVRGGFYLLSLEGVDGSFGAGMGSPWGEVTLFAVLQEESLDAAGIFVFTGGSFITINAGAGYDVRFTHQPNEGFWTVTIGWGWLYQTR